MMTEPMVLKNKEEGLPRGNTGLSLYFLKGWNDGHI